MKFKINRYEKKFDYPEEEMKVARIFAKRLYKEFGEFTKGIILFGSTIKKGKNPKDIDILIVLDDVSVDFSPELVETYRIIIDKVVAQTDKKRLHVQSMKFTSFWEYVRAGDPVAVNILRYGLALVDTGFFDPLQRLLDEGRIRPSPEAIYTYFTLAPASLERAEGHIYSSVMDLYWAAIEASHAALMHTGEVPPSPEHVAEMMKKKLVKEKHLSQKSAINMDALYKMFKKIVNKEIKTIKGSEYDKYKIMSEQVVNEVKKFLEHKS